MIVSKKIKPSFRDFLASPSYVLALGFGSGFSPIAPGTAGTLVGWLCYVLAAQYWSHKVIGIVGVLGFFIGIWICKIAAKRLNVRDPSCVVWDELVAIWLLLWVITPLYDTMTVQALAFLLFRLFDAVKPGPVRWADQYFEHSDPHTDPWSWEKAGLGIMFDDLVAALLAGVCLWVIVQGYTWFF